jgi:NAD(P)H-quinone oxidoreductase subunit I
MPYKVTNDPMVKPLRELVYLPKGVIDPHDMPSNTRGAGLFPKEILEQQEVRASDPNFQ